MDRRRLIVAGMWIAAIAAVGGIYLTLEPDREPSLDAQEAPRLGVEDRAPRARRARLAVPEDERSTGSYRGGPRHTGRSAYAGPRTPRRAWRYRADGPISAQPVVAEDGTVVVGDHRGRVHAVAPDGSRRWAALVNGPVWSAAAIVGDTVYVGSDADTLFGLSARDGSVRLRLRTEGDVDGPIARAPGGTVHFTGGRDLYAMDEDGTVRWRFRARDLFVLGGAAVDSDGTVYVGSVDDHVYAVAADGRLRWDYRTGGDVSATPVIGDDGTIYVGSDDRHVHALGRDGELRWKTRVDGYVRATVALGLDGAVIAGVYGPAPRIVALDPADGSGRWQFSVGTSTGVETGIASSPLVDRDGHVYFGAHDHYVYSLTAEGRLRWIHEVGGDVDSAPMLTPQGMLLVGCDDGYLYAIEDER